MEGRPHGAGSERTVRVGLYDHPLFREHDAGPGHPERPERLDALRRGLREAQLEPRLSLLEPRAATSEELQRIHGDAYVARISSRSPGYAVSPRAARRTRFSPASARVPAPRANGRPTLRTRECPPPSNVA